MTFRQRKSFTLMLRVASMVGMVGMIGSVIGLSAMPSHAAPRDSERLSAEPTRFAVLAGLPEGNDESPRLHRLQEAFEQEHLDFLIQLGPLQARRAPCNDQALFAHKLALDTLPLPVILLPDESLWAACPRVRGRNVDPLEQLERVREVLFADDASLGQRQIDLMRQSEQARFRSYRENVRWTHGNVMFVGLHLSGNNNNYRSEGGRNREFEDRREANRQWLARAFFIARQAKMAAIVIATHADPEFDNKWEGKSGPNLLDGLVSHKKRDGYLEFKRQLRDLTVEFGAPVLLIHTSTETRRGPAPRKAMLDHPLRDRQGKTLSALTRIAIPTGRLWTPIEIDTDGIARLTVETSTGRSGHAAPHRITARRPHAR